MNADLPTHDDEKLFAETRFHQSFFHHVNDTQNADALHIETSSVTTLHTKLSILTPGTAQKCSKEQRLKTQNAHIDEAKMNFAEFFSKDIPNDTPDFKDTIP